MTDFFAKLAGRTLGIEPSPRPVIAPMFAPGPMLAGEYMHEVTQEQAAAGDIERPLYPVPPSTTQGQLRPATQPESRDDRGSDARVYDVQPGPGTIRTHTEQQLSTTPQPEHVSIRPHIQTEPSPVPRSTLIRSQINSEQQQLGSHPKPEHVSIRPHIQTEPSPVPRSTLIRPQINSEQQQLGSHSTNSRIDSFTQPASAPTIKVSIGRIEVRAVTPPAPSVTKKASPTTRQSSLEEYLQARNRGKR